MASMPNAPVTPGDHLQPALELARRTLRFWRPAVAVLAIGVVGTLLVHQLRPKRYRSEAVLYYREGLQWSPNEASSARRVGQRLKETLLARAQLAKVVEEMNLYPEMVRSGRTAEAVEEMLLATTFRLTEGDTFAISFTGETPGEAQRVTTRLTDVLIEGNTRLRSEQAEVARAFLEAEKKRNEAELAAKESEYVRFLAQHPEFLHEQAAPGAVGASLRVRPRALDPDPELSALRREEQRLRRQLATPSQVPRAPQDPALVAARDEAEAKLKATQRDLADRRARFTERHPDVRSAAGMVKEAEEAYQRAVDALMASEAQVAPPDLSRQLAQVQEDIAAHLSKKPGREGPAEVGPGAQRVVALETEWARLTREVAEARERFQQLDSKQFMATMTLSTLMSGQAAQIIVIDPAYVPARPVGMSNTRLFILGIAASVLASVAVAATLGLVDDRIFHRDDAERLELLPVLAEIPLTGAPEDGAADGRRRQLAARPATPGPGLQGSGGIGKRRSRPAVEGRSSEGGPAEPPAAVSSLAPVHAESAPAVPRGPAPLAPVTHAAGALAAAVTVATSAPGVPTGLVRIQRAAPIPGNAPRPLMLEAPDTPAAAGFRVLRHRLAGRSGAILVTSPHAGEGKTLCALNLALALAEDGQAHVLLLEANFRRASVARLLGFHPPVCIGKQLESCRAMQERSWDVATTTAPGLHVAAVAPESELRPVANGPALGVCIEDMRRAGYDHIVVDGPAVLGSAEVNTMEEHVDGILIVLRAGESRVRELRKAVDQIGKSKLLGAVLVAGQAPDVG